MTFTERSRPAREAILAAARATFGERGYDLTTVRTVAGAAGVDPSMVIRYFGSKDGLFAAAVDIDLRLPDLSVLPAEHRGEALARHFLHLWSDPDSGTVLQILLRAATTNEHAAARVREVFAAQVVELVIRLDDGTDPDGVQRRAGLIATQVLGTALTRYVLRLPPVVALSDDEVVANLGPALQHQLDRPAAGRPTFENR